MQKLSADTVFLLHNNCKITMDRDKFHVMYDMRILSSSFIISSRSLDISYVYNGSLMQCTMNISYTITKRLSIRIRPTQNRLVGNCKITNSFKNGQIS